MSNEMKRIEQQIEKEQSIFDNEPAPFTVPVWLVSVFKMACRTLSLKQRALSTGFIVEMIERGDAKLRKTKEKEVEPPKPFSRIEVRTMTKIIMDANPEKLYKDIQEQLVKEAKLQDIVTSMNIEYRQFEQVLTEKKKNLIQLSGMDLGAKKKVIQLNN